ncbi:MAG: alpha-amylase family protein [Thermoanaerobaculia bacterium]
MIDDLWYKNALIYSLDLETFMDADGNGVGDFEGLIRRLDYLETLGVDVLWIAPFQKTPNRDNGYDVSDFYTVDERHGTGGDFVELVQQVSKRGMRVILDLVANHTSDAHPWFQASRSDPSSKYREWYVWSRKRPPDWDKGLVFPGEQKSTWTWDREARAYYFHRFYDFQPDLNMENPDVRAEVLRMIGFWTQLGASGFRVDALPFLIEKPAVDGAKSSLRFEYLREIRSFLQWRAGDAILLGEANVLPEEAGRYFNGGNGIHMMFNFWVNQHLFYGLASRDVRPLIAALRATRSLPPTAQWAQFLRNHDELDLGRLAPEQRDVVFEHFGPDPAMQLYDRGLRRRLASMLGDRPHLHLAYSVLFSLPGTPVIRYGDEIGMGENLELNGRDAVRTPMQWANERSAGFSTADRLVHPVIAEGPFGYPHVNVEDQHRDPSSLLRWMQRMIRLRKECPEIGWGEWDVLPARSPHVLAMAYVWRGSAVVVVHNFDERPHEVRLRTTVPGGETLIDLLEENESRADARGTHRLAVDAHGYRWFRAGTLNYALQRGRTAEEGGRPAKKK